MTLLSDLERAVEEEPNDYAESLATHVNATILEDEIVDSGRWALYHEVIFERAVEGDEENGEYVKGTYSEGATEMQDDTDKEWGFIKVKPVLVTTTKYEVVYE